MNPTDSPSADSTAAESPSAGSTAAEIAAITNLLGRYCHLVDAEPIEAITTVFWSDASLVAPDGSEHTGADAIAAWAAGWDATMRAPVAELRHRISSPAITLDGATADALTYFDADAVASGHLISVRGRYVDRLERRDGEWRFAYRRIETWTAPARQLIRP